MTSPGKSPEQVGVLGSGDLDKLAAGEYNTSRDQVIESVSVLSLKQAVTSPQQRACNRNTLGETSNYKKVSPM